MHQFIQFIVNHWMLWSALVVVVILLALEESRGSVGGVKKLSPQDVTHMINRDKVLLLDVRDSTAYANGHIVGAMNIPTEQLDKKLNKLNKHKQKPVIITCNNGQGTVPAGAKLKKLGFEQVYTLAGGLDAWKNASMPLVRGNG